jgi:hypothetical protein
MSMCAQTQACAHECGAFNTPPHFAHSQDTEAKCHATRGNLALFDMHGLGCGRRVRHGAARVTRDAGVTC